MNFKLRVLTGQRAVILGQISVHVTYVDKVYLAPLVVLRSESAFIPLLGRNWLNILNRNWRNNLLDASVIVGKNRSRNVSIMQGVKL